jgi:hypothetical protein
MKKKTAIGIIAGILTYLLIIALFTLFTLKYGSADIGAIDIGLFATMFYVCFMIFTPKLLAVLSASLWIYELVRFCKHCEKKRFAVASAVYGVLFVLSVLIEIAMG